MCGITGFIDTRRQLPAGELRAMVQPMRESLAHRGPDSAGTWVDPRGGIALGHRRLSIIDLSREGHQPMVSTCNRYVLVFNGEIYNFRSLRKRLEASGRTFRGHSDTEVLLAAIAGWGLREAIAQSVGMFALALWDRHESRLQLVRDRLGIKPLYYGWIGSTFVFGSELKALRAHPDFVAGLDRRALALYLRYNYVPSPYSIYEGISKLPPASILSLELGHDRPEIGLEKYWSVPEVVLSGAAAIDDESEAEEELNRLLRDAVRIRMEADVPLGAFLSGGVDSTTVVALMQDQSSAPVRTYTIGFHEEAHDEARAARETAARLGTDHTELYVTPTEALETIPALGELYDEPFADSSQIPTFLVARLAARDVKVALSGDGGDELFCGYNKYFLGERISRGFFWIPRRPRRLIARALERVPVRVWDRLAGGIEWCLPAVARGKVSGDRVRKLAAVLRAGGPESVYLSLSNQWEAANPLAGEEAAVELPHGLPDALTPCPDLVETMMQLDQLTYLPDDILVKVDRASMGVSLEARVPLLDHRVVELAWRMPRSMKAKGGERKRILRRVLSRYLPLDAVNGPKHGFSVPVADWLRGPLREWAGDLLEPGSLGRQGFFRAEAVESRWREHLRGERNWASSLWGLLVFQAWLDAGKCPGGLALANGYRGVSPGGASDCRQG